MLLAIVRAYFDSQFFAVRLLEVNAKWQAGPNGFQYIGNSVQRNNRISDVFWLRDPHPFLAWIKVGPVATVYSHPADPFTLGMTKAD
jgi:hypothetical protein